MSYFLQRRTPQSVLAVFLGTITFSFADLIAIGSGGREDFVPVSSVAVALVALLASLSGFLVLIHAVAGQLRVDALLSSIGRVARTRLRRQSLHAGERRASTPVRRWPSSLPAMRE